MALTDDGTFNAYFGPGRWGINPYVSKPDLEFPDRDIINAPTPLWEAMYYDKINGKHTRTYTSEAAARQHLANAIDRGV